MASQQSGAWQTASRSRPSHSASRTPQNRSGTASPSQQTPPPPVQLPRQQERPQQPQPQSQQQQQTNNNVWAQRSSSATGSNGQRYPSSAAAASAVASQEDDTSHRPLNGFNSADVSALLGRDATPAVYRPAGEGGSCAGRGSPGAWGSKLNYTASNQPFFAQLAKQIATLEGGG